MNITIIGAGNIGSTLGKKWAAAGHAVTFGVRNPGERKHNDLAAIGRVASVADALAEAEVVLLSLPGGAVNDFAAEHGSKLAGKIVVDATNNPGSPVMNNLEALKKHAAHARLVRAFSTLGWENFANPKIGGVQVDLFYCGNAAARPAVEQLIKEIGLRPVYLGELDAVNAVDGLTRVWFTLAFSQGRGRRIAFKLLSE